MHKSFKRFKIAFNNISACLKIKELNETLSELQEKIQSKARKSKQLVLMCSLTE